MTARRAARAARLPAVVDGAEVPPELLNADAVVWHDPVAFRAFMAARGWRLPPRERLGVPTSPAIRHAAAVTGWARDHGVVRGCLPDWRRLAEQRGLGWR